VHALTDDPRTFNQKVRHRMARDRNPLFPVLCDKHAVKHFVVTTLGPESVARTLCVENDPANIDWSVLGRRFVAKVNHASGGIILVTDRVPRGRSIQPVQPFARLMVHPDDVAPEWFVRTLTPWLHSRYGVDKGEWAYGLVPPRVLVEEFLEGPDGTSPPDVKFFVFGGRCAIFRIDTPGRPRKHLDHFLRDGTPLPVRFGAHSGPLFRRAARPPRVPSQINAMLHAAETLGTGLDFVRVDMYQVGERIVVGELTLYPTNGSGRFAPSSFDRWLGSFWNLPPHAS
jgi:hypothetical protein